MLKQLIFLLPPFNQVTRGVGMSEFREHPALLPWRDFWGVMRLACEYYSPSVQYFPTFGDCWSIAYHAWMYAYDEPQLWVSFPRRTDRDGRDVTFLTGLWDESDLVE